MYKCKKLHLLRRIEENNSLFFIKEILANFSEISFFSTVPSKKTIRHDEGNTVELTLTDLEATGLVSDSEFDKLLKLQEPIDRGKSIDPFDQTSCKS